jgi:hypothetical protein
MNVYSIEQEEVTNEWENENYSGREFNPIVS